MHDIETGDTGHRERWTTLGLLVLIYAVQHLDRQILSILQEPIKQEFLLSDTQIGFLVGLCYAVPFALAGIPLGLLVDRTNRRNLLAIAAISWSAMTALTGVARNYGQMILIRCALGATEAPQVPTSLSIISDLFPARDRGTAIGIYSCGAAVGTLAGFGFGAWIAQAHGWRTAFFLAAVPGILLGIAFWSFTRDPIRRHADGSVAGQGDAAPSLRQVWRFMKGQRSLMFLFTGMAILLMTATGIMSWAASFLMRTHGMSLVEVGVTVGLAFAVGHSGGSIIGGRVGDRLKRRSPTLVPAGGMLWSALALVSAATMVWTGSPHIAVAALTIQFAAVGAQFGPAVGLSQSLVGTRMRGTAGAMAIIVWNLAGFGLGPQLLGLLSDAYTGFGPAKALPYAIATMALTYLVAILLFGLARRTLEADLDRAATA